jgi:hypothetical protein
MHSPHDSPEDYTQLQINPLTQKLLIIVGSGRYRAMKGKRITAPTMISILLPKQRQPLSCVPDQQVWSLLNLWQYFVSKRISRWLNVEHHEESAHGYKQCRFCKMHALAAPSSTQSIQPQAARAGGYSPASESKHRCIWN